jgi:hypothetical protein
MRVLAAAFEDPTAARSALEELRDRFGLLPDDAGIAPLGDDRHDAGRTVLAGRFGDDEVERIREVVAQHGGEVVSDVDERWTRSPEPTQPAPDAEALDPTH